MYIGQLWLCSMFVTSKIFTSKSFHLNFYCYIILSLTIVSPYIHRTGEKLTDEEVDTLLTGIEDSQGQVNYEGIPQIQL